MINHKIHKLKIDIGTHPVAYHGGPMDVSGYHAILDVSDYPSYNMDGTMPGAYYCPIVEWDKWGYAPFYWAVKLLDHYTARGSSIYLHCYAGKHRSVQIGYLYLQSLGHSEEEAFSMFDSQWIVSIDDEPKYQGNWLKKFHEKDVAKGRIPADIIKFMKMVRANPEKSALQILNTMKNMKEDEVCDKDMYITYSEKKK